MQFGEQDQCLRMKQSGECLKSTGVKQSMAKIIQTSTFYVMPTAQVKDYNVKKKSSLLLSNT